MVYSDFAQGMLFLLIILVTSLILIGAAAVLVLALAPPPYRARLTGLFDPASEWNRERTFMWDAEMAGPRDILSKLPIKTRFVERIAE